ncbi:MAG: hypothetical protein ACYCTL_10610 [Acidimicrobiales bacterium]
MAIVYQDAMGWPSARHRSGSARPLGHCTGNPQPFPESSLANHSTSGLGVARDVDVGAIEVDVAEGDVAGALR